NSRIDRLMPHPGTRRVLAEEVAALPVACGAHGPRREAPAAVRADVGEHALRARGAEGALVAADARLRGVRRQRLVAVLAGRPQLEHAAYVTPRRSRPSRPSPWASPSSSAARRGRAAASPGS